MNLPAERVAVCAQMILLWCRHTLRGNFRKREERRKDFNAAWRRGETIVITNCCSRRGFGRKTSPKEGWWFSPRDDRCSCEGINHFSRIRSCQQGAAQTLQTTRLITLQHSTLKRHSEAIRADSKLQIPGEITAAVSLRGKGGAVGMRFKLKTSQCSRGENEKKKTLSLEEMLLYFEGACETEEWKCSVEPMKTIQWKKKKKKKDFLLFYTMC